MNIAVIGTGWVGATHAAVMAFFGHEVFAYDVNKEKVADFSSGREERIDKHVFEPELSHLIKSHQDTLKFTTDFEALRKFLDQTDVIFLCLPTPSQELALPYHQRSLFTALKPISELLSKRNNGIQSKYILVVTKSTAPIGTADLIKKELESNKIKNFGVASNPEFLAEGKAVSGSQNPDRVVIGVSSETDEQILRNVYRHLSGQKFKVMKPADAEAVKLLSNYELFTRIVMTYQVAGRLCELIPELTFENVMNGVTSDERIPKWGHFTSLYAGGSCFKKDAESLLKTVSNHSDVEYTKEFLRISIDGNEDQLKRFYKRAKEAKFEFKNKIIAMLGTSFKQGTNDVRGSPSLILTEWLSKDGVKTIKAYDPKGGLNYKSYFKNKPEEKKITICKNAKEALMGTDACIICTDWPEFKFLTQYFLELKKPYLIMDGRRSLSKDYKELNKAGLAIIAVGSPYISA